MREEQGRESTRGEREVSGGGGGGLMGAQETSKIQKKQLTDLFWAFVVHFVLIDKRLRPLSKGQAIEREGGRYEVLALSLRAQVQPRALPHSIDFFLLMSSLRTGLIAGWGMVSSDLSTSESKLDHCGL